MKKIKRVPMYSNVKGWIVLFLLVLFGIGGCGGNDGDNNPPPPPLFTVSGTFQAPDTALIDSDVNDPFASYISNDDIDAPQQEVPNPGTIGGYVNVPGAGEDGRSKTDGDRSDFFEVTLADGQAINLFIADHPGSDLDLYLYNEGKDQIDVSMGTDSSESLTVTTGAGIYFIEVRAYSGASNYNLTIGQSGTSAEFRSLRFGDEFVPGEVIVRFKNDHKLTKGVSNAAVLAASVGLQARAGALGREILLAFDNETERQQAFQALGIDPTVVKRHSYQSAAAVNQRKMDTFYIVKALRQRPDVVSADLNYIRRATLAPNDLQYGRQWHYPLINLPAAWDIETGDNAVIVAVIDTGVLLDHPDLAGRLTTEGYDFIQSTSISMDGDGIDPDPDDPGDQSPGGSSFHGTHVAGTVAAATDNNTGVAGVTWNTLIMPLRALGRGGGTSYDVMPCVRYAAGLTNDSGTIPSPMADVMNLSLGGGGFSQTEQNVFNDARNQGVIVIAAAGNEGSSSPSYPAAYDNVVSVSAVNFNKDFAWYSNSGSTIDVAAPGGDTGADLNADGFPDGVLSTCGEDTSGSIAFTYCFYQGTSMASPHMAGVAALMKAANPALTPTDLDTLLTSELITEDIGAAGRDDQFGYGLIDAFKAVGAASGSIPAILIPNPSSINFGSSATSKTLDLTNGSSGDTIQITAVTASEPSWLTVTPAVPFPDDLIPSDTASFTVTVDRTGLAEGVYDAEINITSDAENSLLRVSVSMQVGTSYVGGNAGFHYVLLSDPDTLQTRYQVEVGYNQTTEVYTYTFTGVLAGTYQIFAGTDSDNDFLLGDDGEAFGAYQTVDQPTTITVSGNLSGLDFTTGFHFNLPPNHLSLESPVTGPLHQRIRVLRLSR